MTYGVDGKVILTGDYFNTWGSSDPILYGNNRTISPNSNGFIGEIAISSLARITHRNYGRGSTRKSGLQSIAYNKFNGASTNLDGIGTNARDNNTLLVYLWTTF